MEQCTEADEVVNPKMLIFSTRFECAFTYRLDVKFRDIKFVEVVGVCK